MYLNRDFLKDFLFPSIERDNKDLLFDMEKFINDRLFLFSQEIDGDFGELNFWGGIFIEGIKAEKPIYFYFLNQSLKSIYKK